MADSIQAYQKALSKGAGRPTKALLTVWEKRIVRKTCVPSAGDRNESKDDGVNEGDLDEASQFLIGKILGIENTPGTNPIVLSLNSL